MRQLDHPNIVRLIDFSESRQYYYIVLELCPGGELFHQIVRLTYFSEELSRHVIVQVAKAMRYLHEERGVVHRYVSNESSSRLSNSITVILNQRTYYSTQPHSLPPRTQSLDILTMKTKLTKVNSCTVSVLAVSEKSRSQILVYRKLFGTHKP